jgi:nicotinate-nucleotide adenylyltransferase
VRIGVFGGTFDPPHVGHLLLAADARDALQLDRLIFIPAGAQPFKIETPPVASGEDGLEMVRLAVADDANYAVDDAEISRKGYLTRLTRWSIWRSGTRWRSSSC